MRLCLAALLLAAALPSAGATQGGAIPLPLPLFPPNNWWNLDISAAPVDPGSAAFIDFIRAPYLPSERGLHPDFGGDNLDDPGHVYGIPFIQVDGSQPKVVVDFVLFPDESDGVGVPFYPIPNEAITTTGWIEGGPPGNVDEDGDRHMLIVDTTNNDLYELYDVWHNGTNWEAGSGAFFDMDTNNRRPEGWTSADAAGLAILPGLVRYDEVFGPEEIRHAFRVTVRATEGYFYPASHEAGDTPGALPMGARLRLKPTTDLSGYAPEVQKIFRAMQKYGLIVADNGSDLYVSGVYDTRWNNDVLNPAFRSLKATDFEVVQLGWRPPVTLVISTPRAAGAGDPATMTVTAYDQNYSVATGYSGTVAFSVPTDGSAVLPPNYTFTGADGGTHTFELTLFTPGSHVIYATDVADATITGSAGVTVGPQAPANLAATASFASGPEAPAINLTWTPSSGATSYEVVRAASGAVYALVGTSGSASFRDSAVTAGAAYAYKVRALDSASRPSPFSAPDAGFATAFTDDPVVAGTTPVKAQHLMELRQAANALRSAAGLPGSAFTHASLGGITIQAIHMTELRAAFDAARTTLGLPTPPYTDSELTGLPATAVHLDELRNRVK